MPTRKQRGHDTERAVAGWFAAHGWPYAEPVGAGRNGTDVTGMPGLLVEVKARRDFTATVWLRQHTNNLTEMSPPLPLVVWRPDGYGLGTLAAWPVMMRLDDFTALLHAAGYGTGEDQ